MKATNYLDTSIKDLVAFGAVVIDDEVAHVGVEELLAGIPAHQAQSQALLGVDHNLELSVRGPRGTRGV